MLLKPLVFSCLVALTAQTVLAQHNPNHGNHHGSAPSTAPSASVDQGSDYFAVVNGVTISAGEYLGYARETIRKKFYHGTPPESEVAQTRRQAGLDLILRILLPLEAEAMGIRPSEAFISGELEKYERQYGASPAWQNQREQTLPRLREFLGRQSVLDQLENQIKTSVPSDEQAVKDYYEKNPAQFTEPEKFRLSLIMLRIDPSSTSAQVKTVYDEAKRIHEDLVKGGDFSKAAVLKSSDKSAENGGDMGYLHRGEISEELQIKVDKLNVGEITEPTRTLEGFAILRLEDRQPAKLRSLEEVKERALALLRREMGGKAWEQFKDKAVKKAEIRYSPEGQMIMFPDQPAPLVQPAAGSSAAEKSSTPAGQKGKTSPKAQATKK